jgi:predicted  nucleic acid-binding Zn-ribbon protein
MEMDALWNSLLTAGLGFIVWWAKNQHEELKRVQILLNRTREELAKEYVTKSDSSNSMSHIVARFDRLEEKIDRLMER